MTEVEINETDFTQAGKYRIHVKDHRRYRLVFFLLGIVEVLLFFRFAFKLLGANPESFFAKLVYDITYLFVLPFNGLFPATLSPVASLGQRIFDPGILIAMMVYALAAWGIGRLILIYRSKPPNEE